MIKTLQLNYTGSCNITEQQLEKPLQQLQPEIARVIQAQKHSYETDYASLNLPYDSQLLCTIDALIQEKKPLAPTLLIVIGIGGSNLGTIALLEALQGKLYNNNKSKIAVYFADTVDSDYVSTIIALADKELCSGNNIMLNVISKSGTTTETIANFQLFLNLLQQHRPYNYNDFIVITTDYQSDLWNYGQAERIATLAIPAKVGGRYSVFSAVSLFPLALCGINIALLHEGARNILQDCISTNQKNNPATINAALLYELYNQGYYIQDTFLFSVELESIGKWYRQLMAESIGKSHDRAEKPVNNGITPTVSVGSTDLHSVGQLYLSGPYNTATTFVSVEKNNTELYITNNSSLAQLAPTLANKSFATIMDAILQGTMIAYKKNNRPFTHVIIPEKNEYYLGQLMQLKMLEIMYLGFLMNINPFDQPNVELYKVETKKLLANADFS